MEGTRKRNCTCKGRDSLLTLIDNIHPLLRITIPSIGLVLWLQGNFASIKMVQQQESKIIETNVRLDNQYKDLKTIVEQRHQESLNHSNDNRDRMIAVMSEIKDSLKTLYLDRQTKR